MTNQHPVRSMLIDTSSLINSGLFKSERHYPSHFSSSEPLNLNILEALILYDKIIIDGPSFHRNESKLQGMKRILEFLTIADLNNREEKHIYLRFEKAFSKLNQDPKNFDLFRMHTESWMTEEMGIGYPYPSAKWKDVEELLGDDLRIIATSLRNALGSRFPNWGAACIGILRTFYYLTLQDTLGTNLMLDSTKGYFYEPTQRKLSGSTIIDLFDEKVRQSFYERKKQWLGNIDGNSIKLPMLSQYVSNRVKDGRDIFDAIREVRDSAEATNFRLGLGELQVAIDSSDNKALDEVLATLSHRVTEWSKKIGVQEKGRKLNLTVTIPFLEVGTDIELNRFSPYKTTSDKLLVFIHTLLRET